jgi:deoxyribose-phosphate aldolase
MTRDELVERVSRHVSEVIGLPGLPPADAAEPGAALADVPLASLIDHTLLKPEATPTQVEALCAEAREYGFASVCVNPCYVALCQRVLAEAIPICTVVGFPLGATTTQSKVFEARQAIGSGAHEIDMVLAVGALKAAHYPATFDDIAEVVAACHEQGALCKVIIETALLQDDEKVAACRLAAHAGADFVKTSTGFAASGATPADVALMRRAVGDALGVKAAGGIRTLAAAQAMLAAGASRIGASASVQIVSTDAG